ncbi:WD40 repeat domain-containing protein [Streptomyces sp. NPDC053069]|uniref:WD40 repeat domain-containing protein n=1 Tax=Streptomyces sp. NPDC053069 TaxID=3365695 RepID=UPI0037CFC603
MVQREQEPFEAPDQTSADAYLDTDGRMLTSVGDAEIIQWNVVTRRRMHTYRLPPGPQERVTEVTSDGRAVIVAGSGFNMTVRLWDIRAERFRGPAFGPAGGLPTGAQYNFHLSTRGDWIVFTVRNRLEVWSAHTRRRLFTASLREKEALGNGDVSADGRRVALCTGHGLTVWDTRTKRRADSSWQASPRCQLESGLLFTPDGRTLGLQDEHGLRRVRLSDGKELPRIDQVSPAQFDFTPDGKFVAGMGNGDISVWRLDRPEAPVFRYPLTMGSPDDLRIDVKANVIRYTAAGATGGEVVRTLDLGRSLDAAWRSQPIMEAAFSADSSVLVDLRSTHRQATLSVLDGHDGTAEHAIALPRPPARLSFDSDKRLSLSADGQRLAYDPSQNESEGCPKGVPVWDTRSGRLLKRVIPAGGTSGFAATLLTADGRTLITQDDTRNLITLWDTRSGRKLRTVDYSAQAPKGSVGVSPYPVTGDGHSVVTNTGVLIPLSHRSPHPTGLTQCTSCVIASTQDGSRVAIVDTYAATLWDKKLRAPLGVLLNGFSKEVPGDAEEMTSAAFSPDGSTVAVGGSHGTLALWDVTSQRELGTLPTPGDAILSLAFSQDGGTLYAAGRHVTWQKYDIDPDHAARAVCRRAGGPLSPADWHTYLPDVPYRKTC